MRLFKKVAIVGLGLIGGSIGLALKKKGLVSEVVGVSLHKETLALAKKINAIDRGSQDISIIRGADLVILATPVATIIDLAQEISRVIRRDCIVTDVGSTKSQIVSRLDKIFPRYVGSHPLAGSDKRGVINADINIFKDSLCILTPKANTENSALKKINIFWSRLGAKTICLSSDKHDKILSFISHLPHAVAFSLIAAVPAQYLKFASSGLKDTTRIAASDSILWSDIFITNRKNISRAISIFQNRMEKLKIALDKKDRNLIKKILEAAQAKRKNL